LSMLYSNSTSFDTQKMSVSIGTQGFAGFMNVTVLYITTGKYIGGDFV
jgi:hypothetical protein